MEQISNKVLCLILKWKKKRKLQTLLCKVIENNKNMYIVVRSMDRSYLCNMLLMVVIYICSNIVIFEFTGFKTLNLLKSKFTIWLSPLAFWVLWPFVELHTDFSMNTHFHLRSLKFSVSIQGWDILGRWCIRFTNHLDDSWCNGSGWQSGFSHSLSKVQYKQGTFHSKI